MTLTVVGSNPTSTSKQINLFLKEKKEPMNQLNSFIERTAGKVENAKECLKILGRAYKGDYSEVDGRVIQSQLENIIDVLNGDWSIDTFCDAWDIHPKKHCWLKHA